MELYRTVHELRTLLDGVRAEGRTVGMVGTSGGMHEGHLSLIRRATSENDVTALYWGGAPTSLEWQPGSTIAYERDSGHDWPLAEEAGCDILFAPPGDVMFPGRPMAHVSLPEMSVELPQLEDPAHLDLIALAMCKLWNMFGPCRNYSGEKDWQQLAMFTRLAHDLEYPVEVIGCPTVRHDDGVAVSSRNAQLSPEERAVAPVLFEGLCACRDAVLAGARTASELDKIFGETVGDSATIQYFFAVQADTMTPLDELTGSIRLLASIELRSVRLLDNLGVELAR